MNTCIDDALLEILKYLPLRDISQLRPTTRTLKNASEKFCTPLSWRAYIKTHVKDIYDCNCCYALITTKGYLNQLPNTVEWCALCEGFVCVHHLQICPNCEGTYCDDCVGGCC